MRSCNVIKATPKKGCYIVSKGRYNSPGRYSVTHTEPFLVRCLLLEAGAMFDFSGKVGTVALADTGDARKGINMYPKGTLH
jgi:hypothetical protein